MAEFNATNVPYLLRGMTGTFTRNIGNVKACLLCPAVQEGGQGVAEADMFCSNIPQV